jgi:tripartite-type tricarboxylate transporter receptor subunit TctC
MKKKRNIYISGITFIISLFVIGTIQLAFVPDLPAETPGKFYKGKTIEFVFSGGQGGGYHFWSRLIGKYLKKYTGANVVVASKNAGGGTEAILYTYNAKGAEGLLMCLSRGPSQVVTEILDFPGFNFKYDSSKFNYLGRITYDVSTLHVSPKRFKNIKDLRAAEKLTFGTDSPFGSVNFHVLLHVEGLGLNQARFVTGYRGGRARLLATIQGEIDGYSASYDSSVNFYKEGQLIPIAAQASKRYDAAPDLPTIWELGVRKEAEKWLKWGESVDLTGRLIFMPPDTPEDRVRFMRNALDKVAADSKFLAEVKKAKKTVRYLNASEIQKVVKDALSLTSAEKKELKYMLQKKWMK